MGSDTQQIVGKAWNFAHVLRDDGLSYLAYMEYRVPMTFDGIPGGTVVFIDANCLVYAATAEPQYGPACQRLLERIENKLIQGCTSASVLGDGPTAS